MRVKYVRNNPAGKLISQQGFDYFNSLEDLGRPSNEKIYKPGALGEIGYESFVYAINFKSGHCSYYIKHPKFGDISRVSSVCFDIIDPRMSKYWHFHHKYIAARRKNHLFGEIFPSTWIAIKEWIEEPMFFQNYLDSKKREVEIMEKASTLIENEFL